MRMRTMDGPFFETNSFTLDFEFFHFIHYRATNFQESNKSVITKRSFYRFHYFLKRTASFIVWKSNSDATMSNTVHQSYVRRDFYRWPENPKVSLQLLIKRQSEFPVKIRECIRQAQNGLLAGEPASCAMMKIQEANLYFFLSRRMHETTETEESTRWYGPDIEVDTHDQIEVAIRFFPHLLHTYRQRDNEWATTAIQAATTSLKSLPFVPLIAELGDEYQFFDEKQRGGIWDSFFNSNARWKETALYQIVTNKIILGKQKIHSDEFYRQIDDVSLSVLVRLKEKGFLKKQDIWDCVDLLVNEAPSRTRKRLRFFLDWDPTIVQAKSDERAATFYSVYCNSLLEYCIWQCHIHGAVDGMLERFQTLLELGLLYYPEEIGFLFHRDNLLEMRPKPAFPTACRILGRDKVVRVVNESISKYIRGRRDTFHKLVFVAATKDEILLDGLYLLVRRDPAALITLLSKGMSSI